MGAGASPKLLLLYMCQLAGVQRELQKCLEEALVSFSHPFAARAQMRHPSVITAGWWLTKLYPLAPWEPQGVAHASTGDSSPKTLRSLQQAWVSD